MKIPEQNEARMEFYQNLIQKCDASRENRIAFYNAMRMYYLFGIDDYGFDDSDGAFNKIYPHLQQLNSFMFSPETTRFNIDLGPTVASKYQAWVNPMVDYLQQQWHATPEPGLDESVKGALEWAQVYGSTFIKLRPRTWVDPEDKDGRKHCSIQHFIVEPHQMGVLREDRYGLYRQEAFCEHYVITQGQLETELEFHRDRDQILAELQASPVSTDHGMTGSGAVDRLIVTSIAGDSVEGQASMLGGPLSQYYRPVSMEDMIEMTELYVYDSKISDWRIITIMNRDTPIWDRPLERLFLKQTLPYIQICPLISHDYAWGFSRCEKIVRLQQFRSERISDIRHNLRKSAHPPVSMTGVAGIPDEMKLALDTPQGLLTLPDMNAQIKDYQPKIDGNQWEDVAQIDEMIDEMAGLPKINQGQHAKGVRSNAQAETMSELGATRAKSDALTIEDSLDAIATVSVRLLRRYSSVQLREDKDDNPDVFTPSQFPDDFKAKVDGHSSSPVFRANYEAKVFKLLEVGAIDKEEALQLLDMPRKKQLLSTLKEKIEPAEAAAHQEQHQEKMLSIAAKRQRGR